MLLLIANFSFIEVFYSGEVKNSFPFNLIAAYTQKQLIYYSKTFFSTGNSTQPNVDESK